MNSLFTLFYYTLALLLYVVALPVIILFSFKTKYKKSLPSRFFLFNNPSFKVDSSKKTIWFHSCSFGETKALAPIIERIYSDKVDIKISTITQTGFEAAQKYDAEVRYLPFEIFLPFWIKKVDKLVVLEAEFWYMLFVGASSKGSEVILLNARLSQRSFPKYLKLKWFYKKMLDRVSVIYAQSIEDAERFYILGAKKVEVIGNIKLATEIKVTKEYEKPECELIVAGSTHEGEEEVILQAFIKYKSINKKTKLIIIPRHPERFEKVSQFIYKNSNNLSFSRLSKENNLECDIILVDTMGELNNFYNIADIAIIGGTFKSDVGGHNPLEPAFFKCKIISGKSFYLQKELFKYVHHIQFSDYSADGIKNALVKSKDLPASFVDEKINLDSVVNFLKYKKV